jgi:antitoxin CptB
MGEAIAPRKADNPVSAVYSLPAQRPCWWMMSGTKLSTADLDPRRARALFRAWHRGIREMDLIVGQFADAHLPEMSSEELESFEDFLQLGDLDLYKWISGAADRPESDNPMVDRVKAWRENVTFD